MHIGAPAIIHSRGGWLNIRGICGSTQGRNQGTAGMTLHVRTHPGAGNRRADRWRRWRRRRRWRRARRCSKRPARTRLQRHRRQRLPCNLWAGTTAGCMYAGTVMALQWSKENHGLLHQNASRAECPTIRGEAEYSHGPDYPALCAACRCITHMMCVRVLRIANEPTRSLDGICRRCDRHK